MARCQSDLMLSSFAGNRGEHKLQTSLVVTGTDLKAVNGFDKPDRVTPQAADKPVTSGSITKIEVPPRSYSVYQWTS
jgi:alpha-L-arabinofuranosidase